MAETTNLSEGAQLLGLSQRTVRKKLAASYRGADRIKGAKKVGRDWRIPRSEIRRLVDLRAKLTARSDDGQEAFVIASQEVEELTDSSFHRLVMAAQAFVDRDAAEKDISETLSELRLALRDWDAVGIVAPSLVDAIARRVKDQAWLDTVGYAP